VLSTCKIYIAKALIKKASLFHTAVLSIHLYLGQINHVTQGKGKSTQLQNKSS